MTEIKKYIEGISIRLDDTKQQISELEDRVVEITAAKEKKNEKKWGQLKRLWGNIMHINIHIIEVPEGEDRKKRAESIFEDIIAGKLP